MEDQNALSLDGINLLSLNITGVTIIKVVQNKGVIAGISLFIIGIFLACLIKRIITIRRSKSILKQKYIKLTDVNFGDEIEEMTPSKYGDLRFTIDYNYAKGSLIIGELSIHGLQSISDFEIDSYVVVRIEPDIWKLKAKKTNIVHKTNCPNFLKKFYFKIPIFELNRVIVIFEVFDLDVAGSSDKMLGRVRFHVSSLREEEMEEFPIERILKIEAPIEHDEGSGEICIILRHIPLPHILNVTILEAKRLPIRKNKTFPPVYVIVTMFHKKDIIKEKHTLTKFDTRDPFFSETFPFHLNPVKIPYTYLIIKVMKKSHLNISKCIGKLELGIDSPTLSARNQWKSMVFTPRIAVASWHTLSKNI